MNAKSIKTVRALVRSRTEEQCPRETTYVVEERTRRLKHWPVPLATNSDGTPVTLPYVTATFRRHPHCFKAVVKRIQRNVERRKV